jgi:hypothetical protein
MEKDGRNQRTVSPQRRGTALQVLISAITYDVSIQHPQV